MQWNELKNPYAKPKVKKSRRSRTIFDYEGVLPPPKNYFMSETKKEKKLVLYRPYDDPASGHHDKQIFEIGKPFWKDEPEFLIKDIEPEPNGAMSVTFKFASNEQIKIVGFPFQLWSKEGGIEDIPF